MAIYNPIESLADENYLGYFVDEAALIAAYPTGEVGSFANLGSTDNIWIWDDGTSAWVDSGTTLGQVIRKMLIDTDCNTVTDSGSYGMIGTPVNGPIAGEFALEVYNDGSRIMQIGTMIDSTVWTRIYVAGWSSWITITHDSLPNLLWTISGHTGTATRIAGFDGTGAASEYTMSGTGTELALTASPTFTGTVTTPAIKITGGTPGVGKVLTSDADGDATWETQSAGGFSEIRIQDYSGPAIQGILGQYDASRTGTLSEVTLISDTLPVGSNVIAELRKNSTTSGNVLSTTLQITTTEAATNGRYVGTPVTTFSSSAIADGDVFYLYLTSVGSPEALNVRAILRYT